MKSLKIFFSVLLLLLFSYQINSQNGIRINTDESTEGYTFFETFFASHLINNCGEIVNTWPSIRGTDLHAKLMDDGNVIYMKDNLISSTGYNATDIELVYEVIVMSNGHYLCLARQNLTNTEFRDLGYNLLPGIQPRRVDMVLEIDPETDSIVWQWNIKDHMVQQRDQQMANYGVISNNPRKLDMDAISTFDWETGESFMINGFDYNEELDLIALSVRKISEVIIIDHSTTTEEARTSSGGRHGHGGDVLFRWGNPQNYGQGNESDRELYFQHNPNWIKYGEHKGKIMIFNNGLSEIPYSSVEIISPQSDNDGFFILPINSAFELTENHISINALNSGPFFRSGYTSGSKVMPNENIYVTVGEEARLFEMNPNGEIVWEYYIENSGYIFRSEKYPKNFAGFDNKDLSASGTVEIPPSDYNCELFTTNTYDVKAKFSDIKISYLSDYIYVVSEEGSQFDIKMYNSNGQLISIDNQLSQYRISYGDLTSGVYYLRIQRDGIGETQSIFVR